VPQEVLSMKNYDKIGNRNRDHAACSAVTEPTAPFRASPRVGTLHNITGNKMGVAGAVLPSYKATSPSEYVHAVDCCGTRPKVHLDRVPQQLTISTSSIVQNY
jgi:hypothetical protein